MIRVKNPNYVDRLPDEYQEVEYLESTGTQYIDTKVIPQENSRTKTKLEFTSSTQTQYAGFFGAQVDDNNTYGYTFSNVVGNAIKFKGSKNYMGGPTFAINVSYEIDCSINTFNINGANYTNTDTWSQTMDESIYIFTRNSAGVAMSSTFTTGKLYYFMQYEGDVLVRNFVPCYRKSDNIPGLYDLVNNQFYTNAGTGTFLVGKDVNKKDINIKPTYQIRKMNNIINYSNFSLSEVTFENDIFTHSTSGVAMVNQALPTPVFGHKYYGRCMQKTPSGYTFGDGRFEYYCADIAGTGLLAFGTMQDTGGEWRTLSSIQELTGEPEEGTWQLRSFSVSGSHEAYRKELMIIDLTAAFGVGKEPTKEWCDENIPFFIGEYIMPSNWESNGETINAPLKNRYVGGKLVYGEPLMNYEYRFVTVGENGQSYYSTDGETWNPMTGAKKTLNSITYGNDRFVAVGIEGYSCYSLDGETWIEMGKMSGSILTGNDYYGVAYGNGHFVAVGESGLICYSTDGETWTSATGQTTGVFAYKEVIYANDRFVVVGESSYGSYSLNGETWTSMKGLANEMHYGLTYGKDMFVCSSGPIIGSHSSYYCKDGINWIKGNTILSGNVGVQDLAYGNGVFVAVGGNGKSAYSTDGINWTNTTFSSGTFYGITFANNKFICVGNSGYSFYSLDGINWIAMTGLSDNIFYDISCQRKTIPKQPQLVNYTMLYDYGDEYTDITGGWTGGKYITNYSSVGTYTKYGTYMYCKSGGSKDLVSAGFYTTNKINMSDYSKAVFNISQLSPSYVAYIAVDTVQVNAAWTQTVGKRFDTGDNKHSAGLHSLDVSTLTSDLYVKFGCWAYASMIAVDLVFLVKPDDWQKLAEKAGITASSIEDILTNSTTLLSNKAAVDFMIKQCTGDFMASAIQSETFLNALSNSPYNTVIQANEHWNKFLAMVA